MKARIRRDGRHFEVDVIDVAERSTSTAGSTRLRAFFDLAGARPL